MRKRISAALALITALGLIAGAAWAARPLADLTVIDERSVDVADAGSVVFGIDDASLTVLQVHTNPGWVAETEVEAGAEIEVDFRRTDRRVAFNAEMEDGEVRVRVRQDGGGVPSSTTGPDDSSSTSVPSSSSSTGATAPSTSTPGTSPSPSTPATSPSTSAPSTSAPSTSTGSGGSPSSSTATAPSTTVPGTTSTSDGTTSTTIDDHTSTTQRSLAPGSDTYRIPGVATIAIAWADGRLTLVSYTVTSGWTAEIEDQRSDRIRIDFQSEDGDARFEARLDGDGVQVEARKD